MDERASEATFLLNHELLNEAFRALRENYTQLVLSATPGSEQLQSAHAKLQVIGDVEAHLRSIVTDKKMADKKGVSYGR